MRNLFFIVSGLFFFIGLVASCHTHTNVRVQLPPNFMIESSNRGLHNANGTWIYQGRPFNGYIVEKANSRIIRQLPVVNGKGNGVANEWYPNGRKKAERHYVNGKREGPYQGWYPNGNIAYDYFYKNDKYEGDQKSYFEDGRVWQQLQFVHGHPEGKQKSWNDSGRVINNFTIKNGKLYGVIGRYDCMSVYKK